MGWGYLRTRGTRYVRPWRMLLRKRTRIDQSTVQAKLRRGPDGKEWGRGLIVLPHE